MAKAKARTRLVLPALMALAATAAGDVSSRNLPSPSCPALAAAPLIYVLVLSPFGAKTWGERQLEMIRLGSRDEAREDVSAQTSFILLALHIGPTAMYALEMMEAPRDVERPFRPPANQSWMASAPEGRIEGAFEAMGLSPEDVVEPPEMPTAALAVADAIAALYDWGLRRALDLRSRVRSPGVDVTTLRVDPEDRYERPANLRYGKPEMGPNTQPTSMVFAKRVVRSVYKILLGITIGILIWGFVRNTT